MVEQEEAPAMRETSRGPIRKEVPNMVILADTVPEVVLLAQQVRRAKIASERADADAAQAASEAAAARARYEKLDAEHRALKLGSAA